MARNGRIAGSDGQPLGSASEVQQHLAEIFPGIKFALQRAAATSGIQSLDLPGWLAKISGVKYPHWIGMSERERFIISFRLDGEQSIDAIHVAVYGHGVKQAKLYLERLAARTGWRIEL